MHALVTRFNTLLHITSLTANDHGLPLMNASLFDSDCISLRVCEHGSLIHVLHVKKMLLSWKSNQATNNVHTMGPTKTMPLADSISSFVPR